MSGCGYQKKEIMAICRALLSRTHNIWICFADLCILLQSYVELTGENGAHLGNEPLWRVEAQDGDGLARLEAELDESLGGGVGVVVVLLVRPLFPL